MSDPAYPPGAYGPPVAPPPAFPPQYAQPNCGPPQNGLPPVGVPEAGQPQYGLPQYGLPQAGQPQYGLPQAGQPQYGLPQAAPPPYGQPIKAFGIPQQQQIVVSQPVVISTGGAYDNLARSNPQQSQCPHCQTQGMTKVHHEVGPNAWCMVVLLLFMGCILGCCLLPLFMDQCKDAVHKCPNCDKIISKYPPENRRNRGTVVIR